MASYRQGLRPAAWVGLCGCLAACTPSSTSLEPRGSTASTIQDEPNASDQDQAAPVPADPEPSAAPAEPSRPAPEPCDNYLFDQALAQQLAQRPDDRRVRFGLLGLEADAPTRDYVRGSGVLADQILFDCGRSAIVLRPAGGLNPSTYEEMESKGRVWNGHRFERKELPDGRAVIVEGKGETRNMVFVVRAFGSDEVYCEGISARADAIPELLAVCVSLRIGAPGAARGK